MSEIILGCEFNPKNLPTKKIGTCQNKEHYEWLEGDDVKKRGQKLILVMTYSDTYLEKWCDCSKKDDLIGEEYDQLYDKMEKIRFKPDSEKYFCEDCCEVLMENDC